MAIGHPSINGRSICYIALVLVLLVSAQIATAQVTTARLEGTIKDPSNAVIPGVVVVATNTGTNIATEATTNERGLYVFPRLTPGTYTVTAEFKGFKRSVNQGILLQIGDTLAFNISLATGELNETITILANTAVVDTVSAAIGRVVNTRQIEELPLVSRNPLDLVYLQAGANRFVGGGLTDGLRGITSNVTVEGVAATEPDLGSGANSAAAAVPIEAVGEYRVVTSNASAEYGRGAGAQVQLIYRSGTNEFHGSAFDFHRNKALNANSFSNNRDGIGRPTFIRNQFGGSLGGPVIKNKVFFHVTYEGVRQKTDSTQNGLVYTPTLKGGTFRHYTKGQNSTSLVDRVTGELLVPQSDIATLNLLTIDPGRAGKDTSGLFDKYVGNFPAPNNFDIGDGLNTAGYRYKSISAYNANQVVVKGDYALNNKNRISLTYARNKMTQPGTMLLNGQRTGLSIETNPSAILAFDTTLSPTWLNEFRIGGVKRGENLQNPDPNRYKKEGVVIFAGLGGPGRGNPYDTELVDIFTPAVITFTDNMTWIKGNHSFRYGIDLRINRDQVKYGDDYWIPVIDTRYSYNSPTFPNSIPNLNNTDRNLALQLTNDLTGSIGLIRQVYNANAPDNFTPFDPPYKRFRNKEYSAFFQDTWKFKPNLTLNLGIRWEVMPPQYEDGGLYGYPVNGALGVFGISGSGGETKLGLAPNGGRNVYDTGLHNFAPNIGFNWDPFRDGKWSISANYRLSYDRHYFTNTLMLTNFVEGIVKDMQFSAPAGTRLTDLSKMFNSTTGYFDPGKPLGPKAYNRTGLVETWDPGYYLPYTSSWSLRIQREITKKIVVSFAYVGNKVTGQMRAVDQNQLEIRKNGFLDGFLAAHRNLTASGDPVKGEATGVFGQFYGLMTTSQRSSIRNNLLSGAAATAADYIDRVLVSGGTDYVQKAGLPLTFFRMNPQFQGAWILGNNSNSTYNAMKLEISRRFSAGLQVDGNYTFSKSLTDYMGGQTQRDAYRDNANRGLDKTSASSDATNVINANFIYELPLGTGRKFLNGVNPILNGILGGWQLNGIFGFSSGRPLTASSGYNKLTTGDASTANCSGCDPYMSSKVIKVNPDGRIYGLTAEERAKFTQPTPGSAGETAQYFFRGPRNWVADGSVFKVFRLRFLGEQAALQSRFEFINAFNHTRFGSPTLTITSSTFGQISAPTGNFRIIQVALKVLF